MKTNTRKYLTQGGKKFSLKDFSTTYNGHLDKEAGKLALEEVKVALKEYQEALYASDAHSLLIIFQAMDAAGKDSAIEHVMSGLNPQGCDVHSFKTPSTEEYNHDFLWRHYKALPERGRIGIHNRSHYENVLVCKVHPEYILSEHIPGYDTVDKIDKKFWAQRFESIRDFERHQVNNGMIILKFFLHVSRDEQKQRFLDRIDDPAKHWKFSVGDMKERALWEQYMEAYQETIRETSTPFAPWYIIPADKKWYARLAISQVIKETLESLNLKYPELPEAEAAQLEPIKAQLLQER